MKFENLPLNTGRANSTRGGAAARRIRGGKPLSERLQRIIDQQRALAAHRESLEKAQREELLRRMAKIDGIMGAALRAAAAADDTAKTFVRAALDKHVRKPEARNLLKSEGWLD